MRMHATLLLPLLLTAIPASRASVSSSPLSSVAASSGITSRRLIQVDSEHRPCLCSGHVRITATTTSCSAACQPDALRAAIAAQLDRTERNRLERQRVLRSANGAALHWTGLAPGGIDASSSSSSSSSSLSWAVPHPHGGAIASLSCACVDATSPDGWRLVEGAVGADGAACPSQEDANVDANVDAVDANVDANANANANAERTCFVREAVVWLDESLPPAAAAKSRRQTNARTLLQQDEGAIDFVPLCPPCPCGDGRTMYMFDGPDCPAAIPPNACPGEIVIPQPVKIDFTNEQEFCKCIEPDGILQFPKNSSDAACVCPEVKQAPEVLVAVGVVPDDPAMRDCDCLPGNKTNVQSVPIDKDCPLDCLPLPVENVSVKPVRAIPQCMCPDGGIGGSFTSEPRQPDGSCRDGCLPPVTKSVSAIQNDQASVNVIPLRVCTCGDGATATKTPIDPVDPQTCTNGCTENVDEVIVEPPPPSPFESVLSVNSTEPTVQSVVCNPTTDPNCM